MNKREALKRLSRICDPDHPAASVQAPCRLEGWTVALDGCAFVALRLDLGAKRSLPQFYVNIVSRWLETPVPRYCRICPERRLRAWFRSAAADVRGMQHTPVAIVGLTVDRKLVARALSCLASSDAAVLIWRQRLSRSLKALVLDNGDWRIIVMPLASCEPVACFEKRSAA